MLGGDRVALARLMTLVENRAPGLPALMSRLHPHTGRAQVIGITGPPLAGTTVVVLATEAGDAVQVRAAGLLEIADVFLANKADREGAERMRSELPQMLHLRPAAAWSIPVLLTQAASDGGTDAVLDALEQHRAFLAADPERARRQRARREGELIDILDEELRRRLERGFGSDGGGPLLEAVRGGDLDPYTAAQRILEDRAKLERLLGRR